MLHLACDTHTHTIFSRHGYSTVEENVRAAAELRFELLGVTDHFSPMMRTPATTGVDLRDYQHFLNFKVFPEMWNGVRLMHGCEADIIDLEGHLYGWDMPVTHRLIGPEVEDVTLQEKVFDGCDYVIASVHGTLHTNLSAWPTPREATDLYLKALEHPKVLILGHVGRSGLEFDVDEVCAAARDLGKLIEINEGSLYGGRDSSKRCVEIAKSCMAARCMISVGSDAHISYEVAKLDRSRAMLEEIGFPPRLVATRDAETFLGVWKRALG